jgi:hypothetical protein
VTALSGPREMKTRVNGETRTIQSDTKLDNTIRLKDNSQYAASRGIDPEWFWDA